MTSAKDNISIFLVLVTLVLVVGSLSFSFQRFIIKKDYIIEAKITCNPKEESCFSEECDLGDPRCLDSENYFKMVYKKARIDIPLEKCGEESGCEMVLCTPDNVLEFSENESCVSGQEISL